MTNPVRTGSKVKFYLFVFLMLVLSFVHFCVFWVYVNVDTIRLTFYQYTLNDQGQLAYVFKGFLNYTEIFRKFFELKDPNEINMFLNTFRAIIINLIILPIALITAYAFYKRVYGEKVFRVIFYLPSIISIIVQVESYIAMFEIGNGIAGPYAEVFSAFGYSPDWADITTESSPMWAEIYFFCIIAGLGTNVILMSSAMLRIPTSLTEAAELDGCSFYREMFSITIPLIMPTITTWLTMLFSSVFGFVMQPMLIAKGGGTDNRYMTLPWLIFNVVANGSKQSIPVAATYGILLSILVMPIVYVARWLCNKFTPEVSF